MRQLFRRIGNRIRGGIQNLRNRFRGGAQAPTPAARTEAPAEVARTTLT